MWKKYGRYVGDFMGILLVILVLNFVEYGLKAAGWIAVKPVDIKDVPDVVIERESFRRFGLLSIEQCTYCGDSWGTCSCKLSKNPLMFQNRQQQTPETIRKELLKYNVKLDK